MRLSLPIRLAATVAKIKPLGCPAWPFGKTRTGRGPCGPIFPTFRRPGSAGNCGASDSMQSGNRSEEHTSELQSLMRISYAVFCLKKKNYQKYTTRTTRTIQQIHKTLTNNQ